MNQEELTDVVKRSIELRNIIINAQFELSQLNKDTNNPSTILGNIVTKHQLLELFGQVCGSRPNYNKNDVKDLYFHCVKNNVHFALKVIQTHTKQNELRRLAFECLFNVEPFHKYLYNNIKHLTSKDKRAIYDAYRNIYWNNCKQTFDFVYYCDRFKEFVSIEELEQCIDILIERKDSSHFKSLKQNFDLPTHLLEKIDSYLLMIQLSV